MSAASSVGSSVGSSVASSVTVGSGGAALLVGDRYVSPTGNDSNDGLTRDTAWATFGKLSGWWNALPADSVASAVILSGEYTTTTELVLSNVNAITLTLEFEPGVIVDSTAAVTSIAGIRHYGATTGSMTVNLRGAEFYGNNVSSANGLATGGGQKFYVNGLGPAGKLAIFDGYDDGCSCHGTTASIDDIVFSDIQFQNCTKGAFTHVNNAFATHRRCKFIGRSGATLGIGADQSTAISRFFDCDFVPAASNQVLSMRYARDCRVGTIGLTVAMANLSTISLDYEDCFLNVTVDGPGPWNWNRCYGYPVIRIRGTASTVASFTNCVFEGITNTTKLFFSNLFIDNGTWLGSETTIRDCVIYDFGNPAIDCSTEVIQQNHMNANWAVDYCCMFENTANFNAALSISSNLLLEDPMLGGDRSTSTNQADWAVGSGSPCIGAGSSGGNIGFTVADIS